MTHKHTFLFTALSVLFAMSAWAQPVKTDTATYSRITSINDLVVGNRFLILGENNGTFYAIGDQTGSNRFAVEIEADAETAIVYGNDIHEFVISGDPTNLYTFLNRLGYTSHGFLYAASSEDDQLMSENVLDNNGKWTIAIDEETGEATIIAQGGNTHNTLRFNAEEGLFSCYANDSQKPVYIYMEDGSSSLNFYSSTIIEDVTDDYLFLNVQGEDAVLTVTGNISENLYTVSVLDGAQLVYDYDIPNGSFGFPFSKYDTINPNHTDCWHLFCAPINEYNMLPGIKISGEYELYSFDEPTLGWIYEVCEPELYIPLPLGKGYLFAMPSSNTHTRFGGLGTLQGSKNDLSFPLSYTESENHQKGFNLVGNPFPCNAYANMDYMVLDETGSNFIAGNVIKTGYAIFVQAKEANQEITFSRNAPETTDGFIEIGLSQNEGPITDNVRIFLNEGHRMNKFYINSTMSSIYIFQNKERLGITSADPQGELPIHFEVIENGSYTLTVSTDNVEAQYLHLIDNLTGIDTDLLANPSYTFNAKTSDYASRFKLVFSTAGIDENNATTSFAYMRGNDLVIDNIEGSASLQITDMTGRTISTETICGNYTKTLNVAPGIYILNLNGMTQKIAVK